MGNSDQFAVDTDRLTQHVPALLQLAADADAAMNTLQQQLTGLGTPWGDDDTGRKFAESYVPNEQRMSQGGEAVGATLRDAADRLKTTASTLADTEASSRILAKNVADAVGNLGG